MSDAVEQDMGEPDGEHLAEQRRLLGLYDSEAPTMGDGNCLFRTLSDQLYACPSREPLPRPALPPVPSGALSLSYRLSPVGRSTHATTLLAPMILDLISVPTAAVLETIATHSGSASPLTCAVPRRAGVAVIGIGEYGNGDEFGRDECTLKYLGLRTLVRSGSTNVELSIASVIGVPASLSPAAPSAPVPGINVSQTARYRDSDESFLCFSLFQGRRGATEVYDSGPTSTRDMRNGYPHLTGGRTYDAYSALSPAVWRARAVCLRRVCLRDDKCIGGTGSAVSAYHTGAGRRYGEMRR
ncbi:hypothetical protein K438DRAFT_1977579 [Mycena galopus ATCC 62051]|nr:hypothetical protein K438DRAFT_1977579 [Mycena galopus ATCC 62051]